MPDKYWDVVRYFMGGFRPVRLQEGLTKDEALAICRINNGQENGDEQARGWFDIAQPKGLF